MLRRVGRTWPAVVLAVAVGACGGSPSNGDAEPQPPVDANAPPPPDAAEPPRDAAPEPFPLTPRDSASVFFSGHSLINVNTPTFFEQLAERQGRTVNYQLQMGLGSTMGIRLGCPRSGQQADGGPISYDVSTELRRSGAYDTLILTERHDILGTIAYERSTAMARRFRDAFVQGNPDGQPFLFESWYNIDVANPTPFRERAERELLAWQCIASKVNESRGSHHAMLVIPAGQALSELVGDIVAGRAPGLTNLRQIFADNVHLTNAGNYFISLLHYGVVYRRSVTGLGHTGLQPIADAPPSLSAESAAYLQELANRWVQRTFADAALSQRSDAECVAALPRLCEQVFGAGEWGCRQIAMSFRDDTAAVPTYDGSWCRR